MKYVSIRDIIRIMIDLKWCDITENDYVLFETELI